jgi:hypothetical protein
MNEWKKQNPQLQDGGIRFITPVNSGQFKKLAELHGTALPGCFTDRPDTGSPR